MKARGDNAPSNAFTLEEQPKKSGYVLVRFFENVNPFSESAGELTISGYEYDEYHLELKDYAGLEMDILNNYDSYMAQAKLLETQSKTIPELLQQIDDLEYEKLALASTVADLEKQVTDAQMALCDVYEQVLTGEVI